VSDSTTVWPLTVEGRTLDSGFMPPSVLDGAPIRNDVTGGSLFTEELGANRKRTVMRKLIYSMTVSLDGYIAGPDGAIDWTVPRGAVSGP
jgi:hypothetical protein